MAKETRASSEEDKKKKRRLIIVIGLLLVVIAGLAFALWQKNAHDQANRLATGGQVYKGDQANGTMAEKIAIPGYESITLKANQLDQKVKLDNPKKNTVYFRMSLILPDGTTIWRSKLVSPGKGEYNIRLRHAVPAGTYPKSTLRYECFSLKNQTPLNGSAIKLKLIAE